MASSTALPLGSLIAITMLLPTLATVHTVGDSSGWAIGADYSSWTGDKTFAVVFNYGAGHTVDEVKESDYKSCSAGNSISTDSSGATTIALKTAGTHYFICSVPGHCSGGMKLAVTVKAGKDTTPSTGKASPSDGTATTPTSTTTTTTTAARSNSASTSGVSSIVAMLIVSWISFFGLRMA
ncbi:Blue type 1 copper protein [Vigna unguiculata]|uniref:Blue type 1 copper protein n=1 Tax=Vigna unguiculata TaxID=3917 RepID=A0A4D6LVT8_VIGUN|nr:Blue type 1 copper protein [Vigna unguiculata]